MISEDYDHRWEPLIEVHFSYENKITDENYIYCLCSRTVVRDGIKIYYAEKENGSESDNEIQQEIQSEAADHSHVHFSVDISEKTKCEKDEGASCYCSASHTDNCCSTDEHDQIQNQVTFSSNLQPSDSGADLTYQDGYSDSYQHSLSIPINKHEKSNESDSIENYLSESSWDKFWAINGERLIWASWIKTYSDYINPAFLNDNNELFLDENSVPQKYLTEEMDEVKDKPFENMRERKFSYDSKVNPYKKSNQNAQKSDKTLDLACDCTPVGRRRSCSEHDRMLSPRTLATTDSMTNVTKITLSSYDVTSNSSPIDDYSVSSATSEDPSNDQTRIANIDILDQIETPLDEADTEAYWQNLWKRHFGEQYALHYANYLECQNNENAKDLPVISVEMVETKNNKVMEIINADLECENSEGNSQEMPSVIEISHDINVIKLEEKAVKPKKGNTRRNKPSKYANSVGLLLQNLLKDEANKQPEIVEADGQNKCNSNKSGSVKNDLPKYELFNKEKTSGSSYSVLSKGSNDDDDDNDPPENKPIKLKRRHEQDDDFEKEKIFKTFETMGLCFKNEDMPHGELVYRKQWSRLRIPKTRKFTTPRKIYFDADGIPCLNKPTESQDEYEGQTDDDCTDIKLENESSVVIPSNSKTITKVPIEGGSVGTDLDTSLSGDGNESLEQKSSEEILDTTENQTDKDSKRKKRKKRRSPVRTDMPPDLSTKDKSIVKKYWRRRHSLFHRFDEGIKLDTESWFSVTPEKVARHLAERCRSDVIIDAFCGAGGNTIQFAWLCERVIAIDIDPHKVAMARHNAEVYGVAERVEFIVGDFFQLAPTLKADVVFLSPPWGGPHYALYDSYDLETMLEPKPSTDLIAAAEQITHNIALYVPRNTRSEQLVRLAKNSGAVEIEQNFLGRRFIALTAYYGDLVNY